jgi:threonine dehydratase
MAYVSPYNDPRVVAGQGTVGLELDRQLGDCDRVYVAVGGGGLIGGIGAWLREQRPGIEIVACSPQRSPVMHASLAAGRIVELPAHDTLSDATAGGIEPGSVTFSLCQRVVDRSVVVGEAEIASALRLVLERHHTLIEGAAACAVAGYLGDRDRPRGDAAAIVLCGANIGLDTLRAVLGARQ